MPQITANGIAIEYETHGDPANPPLLLIMGLGAQLTLWPIELVEALVARGFYVIRHDNRDIGLSEKFGHGGVPNFRRVALMRLFGLRARLPYRLTDMADDAAGLLAALGINSAHIVGGSMGGMIAQLLAIHHPQRVRTLTSIFSTTGNPRLPRPRPEAMNALLDRAPDLREARRLMRADADTLLAALRADPFDPAALDAAMATMRGRLEAQLALGGEALRGLLLGMEPAERLAFADRLEKSLRREAARPGEGDRKGDDHKEGDD